MDVKEIKERALASTSVAAIGERRNYAGFSGAGYPVTRPGGGAWAGFSAHGDAVFYVNARRDVLDLVAEIERLTDAGAELRVTADVDSDEAIDEWVEAARELTEDV